MDKLTTLPVGRLSLYNALQGQSQVLGDLVVHFMEDFTDIYAYVMSVEETRDTYDCRCILLLY